MHVYKVKIVVQSHHDILSLQNTYPHIYRRIYNMKSLWKLRPDVLRFGLDGGKFNCNVKMVYFNNLPYNTI